MPMPNTGLATRCPACGTMFRVVPDQLRVSEGWVRCGRCSEVFDASRSLTDIETGEPRRGFGDPLGAAAPQPPPPQPAAAARPPEAYAPPPAHRSAIERAFEESSFAAALNEPIAAPLRVADQPPVAPPEPPEPRAEPDDRPSFVRQAERAQRWQRPGVRVALVLVCLLGSVGLAAQAAYEWRDLAAARLPEARPLLEQACAALGCKVDAARAIDSLAVESSGLVRVERSSIYRLSVALRNRAGFEVALPALDITLTDSQGRVVARKVVQMSEMGMTQTTLAGGAELALQATLQAASTGAPETIVGYTIELFYP